VFACCLLRCACWRVLGAIGCWLPSRVTAVRSLGAPLIVRRCVWGVPLRLGKAHTDGGVGGTAGLGVRVCQGVGHSAHSRKQACMGCHAELKLCLNKISLLLAGLTYCAHC
jgi:hypothetical protein